MDSDGFDDKEILNVGNGWKMSSTSFFFEANLIGKELSSTKLEADVVEVSSLFGLNKA